MNILVFRYNISFIDLPLGEFGEIFPSVMIFLQEIFITSGNISPNSPRSGFINDNKYRFQFGNEETFTHFKIKLRVT